ncbi:MAG: cupredoxin domain-containing protein [Acidimicrobiales bacterium]
MKRLGICFVALCLLVTGCGGSGDDYSRAITRTVRVDWNFDEVAVSFLGYYPQVIEVRPGDTLNFRQAWSGEGHSVTMGTMVDEAIKPVREIIKSGNVPDEPPPEIQAKLDPLPGMIDDNGTVRQSAGQPCYLATGAPPLDTGTPCPKVPQPEFNGRQSYYSSGFIPYEGKQGNTYRVKLSDDIVPGTYTFYCNYHGPLQSGEIMVKAKGTQVPSQSSVDRLARTELQALSDPIVESYEEAKAGRAKDDEGNPVKLPLSGWFADGVDMAFVDEFIPRTIRAKVNERVTWTMVGPHTVSFNVPPYLPQFIISADGTVTFNPQAFQPVNSPAADLNAPEDAPPPAIDAGRWDGSTFVSSGLMFNGTYSLTFAKTGRYRYACLVHPRMVGEVVVS